MFISGSFFQHFPFISDLGEGQDPGIEIGKDVDPRKGATDGHVLETETRNGRSDQELDPGIVEDQDPGIVKNVRDPDLAIVKGHGLGTERANAKSRGNRRNRRRKKSPLMAMALLNLKRIPREKVPVKDQRRPIDGEDPVRVTRIKTVKDGDLRRDVIEPIQKLKEIMTKKKKGLKSSPRVHQKKVSIPWLKTWTFPIHHNEIVNFVC